MRLVEATDKLLEKIKLGINEKVRTVTQDTLKKHSEFFQQESNHDHIIHTGVAHRGGMLYH